MNSAPGASRGHERCHRSFIIRCPLSKAALKLSTEKPDRSVVESLVRLVPGPTLRFGGVIRTLRPAHQAPFPSTGPHGSGESQVPLPGSGNFLIFKEPLWATDRLAVYRFRLQTYIMRSAIHGQQKNATIFGLFTTTYRCVPAAAVVGMALDDEIRWINVRNC